MDDLDQFVDDAAVNAFVAGIHVDVSDITGGAGDDASRMELASALLEDDEMLASAVFGEHYEQDLKAGKYSKLSADEVAKVMNECELAIMLYPQNLERIQEFIKDNRKD